MPSEFRQQLRTLLPYTPPNETVAHLVQATRDAGGTLLLGSAVVNRPWDWVENVGDMPGPEAPDDRRRRPIVKNTSSIPLEYFCTRATGEFVPLPQKDPHTQASIRTFQDTVSGESVFARDWIESRISFDPVSVGTRPRTEGEDELGALPTFPTANRLPGSRRSSPSGSTLSRGSGHLSAPPSRFQSPFSRMSGTTSETIDVDAVGPASVSSAARAGKRKASTFSNPDSDIEIVDGPPTAGPSAKKARAGKGPVKTRGGKKK